MIRIIILLAITLAVVRAEDWTVKGTTYKNVKVLSHDAAFVTILDEDGGAKIALSDLTPDLQKHFGFDAAKAAAAKAAADAQEKKDQAALAKEEDKTNAQKQAHYVALAKDDAAKADDAAAAASARTLILKVTQVLPDGLLCAEQKPEFDGPGDGSGPNVLAGYSDTGSSLFLECPSGGHAEGDIMQPMAAQAGTYTYTDTQGASRTVQKWKMVSAK
jgi:hypothetical protein